LMNLETLRDLAYRKIRVQLKKTKVQ